MYPEQVRTVIESIYVIIGLILNILTIIVFCTGRRCSRKDYRVVVLNHCAASIWAVLLTIVWILVLGGIIDPSAGEVECQLITIHVFLSLTYYIIVYLIVAMALDRAMIVWSIRAEANRGRLTAVILSVTWFLSLLSSCEELLRTSYSELKPPVTTTLTYNATTLYTYHTDPPRKYCQSDYDQVYGGNTDVANSVTLFVALIPVLMIVGTSLASCIKTRRRHSNGQQTAQRRKVGNIPSLWREDPKLWCVCGSASKPCLRKDFAQSIFMAFCWDRRADA